MTSPWIQTRDGHVVDLLKPDLTAVSVEEVAHSLARLARFTGHTRTPGIYSVAQHSVLVSDHVPPASAYAGLMHDAHEAIIGDISSPVKLALRAHAQRHGWSSANPIHALEWPVIQAMAKRFGYVVGDTDVAHADLCALVTERRDLLGDVPAKPWDVDDSEYPAWDEPIVPWDIDHAKLQFLEAFERLAPKHVRWAGEEASR